MVTVAWSEGDMEISSWRCGRKAFWYVEWCKKYYLQRYGISFHWIIGLGGGTWRLLGDDASKISLCRIMEVLDSKVLQNF